LNVKDQVHDYSGDQNKGDTIVVGDEVLEMVEGEYTHVGKLTDHVTVPDKVHSHVINYDTLPEQTQTSLKNSFVNNTNSNIFLLSKYGDVTVPPGYTAYHTNNSWTLKPAQHMI
jgi:hypothetical protein